MSWDFVRDEEHINTADKIKKHLSSVDEKIKDALLAELLTMHHKHNWGVILGEIKSAVKDELNKS